MKLLVSHAENKHAATVSAHAEALAAALQAASTEHEAAVADVKSEQALEFTQREEARVESLKSSLAEAHKEELDASESARVARAQKLEASFRKRLQMHKDYYSPPP